MAVTLHEEVLEARNAWGGQMASSFAKVSFFSGWFSVIASMTRSQSLNAEKSVAPVIRSRTCFFPASSSLALAMRPSSVRRRPPSPRSRSSGVASTTTVPNPACADTWTMPEPMSPHPITPTFLMAMLGNSCSTAPRAGRRCRGSCYARSGLANAAHGRRGKQRLVVRIVGTVVDHHVDPRLPVADAAVRHAHGRIEPRGGNRREIGPQRLSETRVRAPGLPTVQELEDGRGPGHGGLGVPGTDGRRGGHDGPQQPAGKEGGQPHGPNRT